MILIKKHRIQIEEIQPVDQFLLVKGFRTIKNKQRPISFVISKDLKYVFFGKAFDTTNNKRLLIKKSPVPYKNSASMTYGSGEKEYYLFTDPECPYCKKFEANLTKRNLKNKIRIHYYLYPLDFHKNARRMSQFILSHRTNGERLESMENLILNGNKDYQLHSYTTEQITEFDKHFDRIDKIVKSLGVMGTPTIIEADGTVLNMNEFFERFPEK